MLARQIGVDHLQDDPPRRRAEIHSGAAGVAGDRLAGQLLLVGEVVVEAAAGEAGVRHDLIDRDRLEAVTIEHPSRALDDAGAAPLLVLRRIGHERPPLGSHAVAGRSIAPFENNVLEHILPAGTVAAYPAGSTMKLYYFETPNAGKACAVARYLNAPVEFVRVDLTKGEHRTPAFLAINPNGKMPALEDGAVRL
jgi:hypothetical protein